MFLRYCVLPLEHRGEWCRCFYYVMGAALIPALLASLASQMTAAMTVPIGGSQFPTLGSLVGGPTEKDYSMLGPPYVWRLPIVLLISFKPLMQLISAISWVLPPPQ